MDKHFTELQGHWQYGISYETPLSINRCTQKGQNCIVCLSECSRVKDNFSYFSLKHYVVTPYLNCLDETVQMRGHSIIMSLLSLIFIRYSLLS